MTVEQIRQLLDGEKVCCGKGYVFIDKAEDYVSNPKFEYGFMVREITEIGALPGNFHCFLGGALEELLPN